MKRNQTRDVAVGLFVLAGFAAIAYLSLQLGGLKIPADETISVFADFDEIGGLRPRAPVVISGVQVGQVDRIDLSDDYRARVFLALDAALELPVDTSASIVTSGVLGDRYVSMQLGGDDRYLEDGDEIEFVESAVILERLIGKLIHDANLDSEE